MIKIHNKLWYINHKDRDIAYMTYFENNKAFESRSDTGSSWARCEVSQGIEIDNVPLKGFKVIGSVGRWSTSNKLFQIRDPRGFVVEIPTNNLATLLQFTVVKNGVIQDECIWGREGSNHILLPINSPPYADAKSKLKTLNNLISPKDLKPHDWVKIFNPDYEEKPLYFAGRGKITWQDTRTKVTVTDKWTWLFIEVSESYDWLGDWPNRERIHTGFYTSIEPETKKVKQVIYNHELDWLEHYPVQDYVPKRILNKFEVETADFYDFLKLDSFKIVNVEYK